MPRIYSDYSTKSWDYTPMFCEACDLDMQDNPGVDGYHEDGMYLCEHCFREHIAEQEKEFDDDEFEHKRAA